MNNPIIHKAERRGKADFGWLKSRHTFSFGQYFNPDRVQFGALRVLNDDIVAPGMGFGTHPHNNMEIISIPLSGSLEHKDSMGNTAIIRQGDVQVMSAGTGIRHSEYNHSQADEVKFLQIWVFPNKQNVEPRYDQITLEAEQSKNRFQQIVAPNPNEEGVWIYQDAWFHLGRLDQGVSLEHTLNSKANGLYAFILSGEVNINGHQLHSRDGAGFTTSERLSISAQSRAEVLLMEVPM